MTNAKALRFLLIAALACASKMVSADEPKSVGSVADNVVDLADSKLVKILTGRNETLRLRAIAPLKTSVPSKNAALDELLFALQEHGNQVKGGRPLAHSTTELVELIASIDQPLAHQALIEMLNCEHMHISMLCADALGRNQCVDAIEPLKQLVVHEKWETHYGFRFNLIRALTLMDHPDAYEFLSQIRRHIDGQLLHELNQVFKDVTLDDFLGDQDRYDAWKRDSTREPVTRHARKSNSDSIFKNASYSESAARIKLQRQQYYGIDIEAKRLLFVIDHSGSMKANTKSYGRWGTRLGDAKRALTKAIEELPEDHEFGIIFYSQSVRMWKPELVYATAKNKKDATTFVYRLGVGGSTNTYGALRASMDFDDDLEAVFVLTDGKPSSGNIVDPGRIVDDIVYRNRLRHLKINTIGIAVNDHTKLFLKSLAQRCSGQFTQPE
ncbi:MAG: VWA domain-containing protein [Pirellulaceae bacterium]